MFDIFRSGYGKECINCTKILSGGTMPFRVIYVASGLAYILTQKETSVL